MAVTKDQNKTKTQLIRELEELRKYVADEELVEQNRYNKLKAEIWKLAADPSITDENVLIKKLLDTVGQGINISRASYLIRNPEKKAYTIELQWCKKGLMGTRGETIPIDKVKHVFGLVGCIEIPKDMDKIIKIPGVRKILKSYLSAKYKKLKIKSSLLILYGDPFNPSGFFTFSESDKKKKWNTFEKNMLTEIVNITYIRSQQLNAQKRLREQNKYSNLRAEIWKVSAQIAQEDELIQELLNQVGPFFNVDNVSFMRIYPEKKKATVAIQWKRTGSKGGVGVAVPLWIFKRYLGKLYILVSKEDIPKFARPIIMPIMKKFGTTSSLVVPYGDSNDPNGYITANAFTKEKEWSEEEIHLLQELSKIISTKHVTVKSEEELKSSEDKFKTIFENVSDTIVYVDKYGTIIDANKRGEVYGRIASEIIGKNFTKLGCFSSSDLPKMIKLFKEVITGKTDIKNMELNVRHKDGHEIPTEVSISLVKKDNKIEGFICLAKDITERKKAEEELANERTYLKIMNDVSNMLNTNGSYNDVAGVILRGLNLHGANIGLLKEDNKLYVKGSSTDLGKMFANAARSVHFNFNSNITARNYFDSLDRIKTLSTEELFDLITDKGSIKSKMIEIIIAKFSKATVGETIIAPLNNSTGNRIGAVLLTKRHNQIFNDQERSLISSLCNNLALAIEKKIGEQRLRESEKKLHIMFDSIGDGIVVTDLEGNIIEANNAIVHMGKYSQKDEIIGRNALDFVSPEDRTRAMENMKKEIEVGHSLKDIEYKVLAADGSKFYIESNASLLYDMSGNRVGLINVIRNITERKKAEKTLEDERNNLINILNSMEDGVYIVNQQYDIQYVNPALKKEFGAIGGKKCYQYFEGRTESCPWCKNKRIFTGETVRWEWHSKRNNRTYDLIDTPLTNPDGSISKLEIFRDITEYKQAEEEKAKLEVQLRQSEKMEAIGQLAGGIAHDFNNQLGSIVGFADLIKNKVRDDETLSRYIKNILVTAKRSTDLTKQLLAFARKGKYRAIPVNIHNTIFEVVSLLKHSIEKKITIKQHLNADSYTTNGDPSQLQNAILNLALNARDAMPDGGELTFTTDTVILDDEYRKNTQHEITPGHYLKVCIRDTGTGMDEKTQQHIFEPFFTTKDIGQGTGMGLAAVYGTVRNHKGIIEVSSKIGHGTTFTVYLPLAEVNIDTDEDDITKTVPIPGSAHILLVDDEEIIAEMAHDMLEFLGYKVTTCKNGKEALEFYKKSWEDIKLVILDIVMPEMDGKETYLAMQKINPDVKVLVSSGYTITGRAREILAKGADDFLQKPYRQKELSKKVAKVLGIMK